MTVTTKNRPPEVTLKSLVARASCAVLGFRIPHMFSLLKLDVAKIFEVIFACPYLPWSGRGTHARGRTEVLNEVALRHPIVFDDFNLCDMHGSGKLR